MRAGGGGRGRGEESEKMSVDGANRRANMEETSVCCREQAGCAA